MPKINKKDKLNAMLQMWTVLREGHDTKHPWSSQSNEYKMITALERELTILLGIPYGEVKSATTLLSREEVDFLVAQLKQVQGELRTLKTEANARYEGNPLLDKLIAMLEGKLKSVPVPAKFDTSPVIQDEDTSFRAEGEVVRE